MGHLYQPPPPRAQGMLQKKEGWKNLRTRVWGEFLWNCLLDMTWSHSNWHYLHKTCQSPFQLRWRRAKLSLLAIGGYCWRENNHLKGRSQPPWCCPCSSGCSFTRVCIWATLIEFSGSQRNKIGHRVGRVHIGEALGEVQGEVEHRYTKIHYIHVKIL